MIEIKPQENVSAIFPLSSHIFMSIVMLLSFFLLPSKEFKCIRFVLMLMKKKKKPETFYKAEECLYN